MRKYKLRLVEGTDDQYTVHTDNFGTMLCGEQYEDFVRQYEFEEFIELLEEARSTVVTHAMQSYSKVSSELVNRIDKALGSLLRTAGKDEK